MATRKAPPGRTYYKIKLVNERMTSESEGTLSNEDALHIYKITCAGEVEKPDQSPIAAIKYAATCDDPKLFLEQWIHGDWPEIKRDWADVPEEIYPVGAVRG